MTLRFRAILAAAAVGAAILIALAAYGVAARRAGPGPAVLPPGGVAVTQPSPAPAGPVRPAAATHPTAKKWITKDTYLDDKGRLISRRDSDGDGLFDADELLFYGTLRYDSRTRANARRIDLPLRDPDLNDTDGDGLPDDWEMYCFGTLKCGPWDDPDDDGFPNLIEYQLNQSPIDVDLVDPKSKPKYLSPPSPVSSVQGYSKNSGAFWQKQDKARERLGRESAASRPATRKAPWVKPRPTIRPASSPASTAAPDHFREMAKRPLRPEEDTDKDGLPDVWERKCFGDLRYGPWDDPDDDGFPNLVEWYRGTDPVKVDLLDPRFKPADLIESLPTTDEWASPWDIRLIEFWKKQEAACERLRR